MTNTWLPPLLDFASCNGEAGRIVDATYVVFREEFVPVIPPFQGQSVTIAPNPRRDGKERTFWHLITKGDVEDLRHLDVERCSRMRWPRALMTRCPASKPSTNDEVIWWKNRRDHEERILIALNDFSYVVVLANRTRYLLIWTAYPVEFGHRKNSMRREYEEFWRTRVKKT